MTVELPPIEVTKKRRGKPWVVIAAYDVSTGASSEGHVAFNLISRLSKAYRIVLVTRSNNKEALHADSKFAGACRGVHVVGYDLPRWARWWKRGARFYQIYAYLWQMSWPLAVKRHTLLRRNVTLVHVLNFHNDSIPSLAWCLGLPVIWGPVNHNELVPAWRREIWPTFVRLRHILAFFVRRAMWATDPFLRIHTGQCRKILVAGEWVERRLRLQRSDKVIRRSQLGIDPEVFQLPESHINRQPKDSFELVCAGRLDWIKGVDLAIGAMAYLPSTFQLRIVGKGPAKARLKALVRELGVEDRVTFSPPVSRSELAELYANSDMFLFTSAEVAGLVWIEALACGLPVVAFGGSREVAAAAHDLPGIYLVNHGNHRESQVKKLALRIQEVASIPHDRGALRQQSLSLYQWEELSKTIHNAYRNVHECVE